MITSVVVFIIIIMTFSLVTHPMYQTSHTGRNWRSKGYSWNSWNFLFFFIDIFPPSAWTGDSSPLPLEVQSFPPTLCWWQDFNNSSVFGLHCAGGPVRPSSSVASEEPSTNQDEQDFLWLFDLLKLQAQEGKNGWGDKEWLWLLWSYFVFL